MMDQVVGRYSAPRAPEAGRLEPAKGIRGGHAQGERQGQGAGEDEQGVSEPIQEGIRPAESGADEAPGAFPSFEELLEIFEARVENDEGVAEHILLGGLEGLDQHEIDGEEAVHGDQDDEHREAEPRPPGPGIHAASRSGASKSRNSRSRAPSRNGTRSNDKADAGPNWPAWIASQ